MVLDTFDTPLGEATGSLLDDVIHEMGHVLGIGTLWQPKGLIANSGLGNPGFIGAMAVLEYNRAFGLNATSVPVEPFVEGHWDEAVFTNEMMTPFDDPEDVLSRMTIASLADLGYQVNFAPAEPFGPLSSLVGGPSRVAALSGRPKFGHAKMAATPADSSTDHQCDFRFAGSRC